MRASEFAPILNIPESRACGTRGVYEIKHMHFPAGHEFSTTTTRAAAAGQRDDVITFRNPVRFHELRGPTGTWMTDLPNEQAQANRVFHDYRGEVLVGGLGLGYAATRLAQRREVQGVHVVERSSEVIALVHRHLKYPKKIKVVRADLFDFLRDPGEYGYANFQFTRAFYDIWQLDNLHTFFETVTPLLHLTTLAGNVRTVPDCWNEDVMRWQLLQELVACGHKWHHEPGSREAYCTPVEEAGKIYHNWRVLFFRWLQAHPHADTTTIYRMMLRYVSDFGRPGFEAQWRALAAVRTRKTG